MPSLDPDAEGPLHRMPVSAPFHGAVQVEDYQMVPLLKALAMPRINPMVADDVELGKTIEAALILSELLIRRRIQRALQDAANDRAVLRTLLVSHGDSAQWACSLFSGLLEFDNTEKRLINAFGTFRTKARCIIASESKKRRLGPDHSPSRFSPSDCSAGP